MLVGFKVLDPNCTLEGSTTTVSFGIDLHCLITIAIPIYTMFRTLIRWASVVVGMVKNLCLDHSYFKPFKYCACGSVPMFHLNVSLCWQVQTRSADEPMTTSVYCNGCGNRWKVSQVSCGAFIQYLFGLFSNSFVDLRRQEQRQHTVYTIPVHIIIVFNVHTQCTYTMCIQ